MSIAETGRRNAIKKVKSALYSADKVHVTSTGLQDEKREGYMLSTETATQNAIRKVKLALHNANKVVRSDLQDIKKHNAHSTSSEDTAKGTNSNKKIHFVKENENFERRNAKLRAKAKELARIQREQEEAQAIAETEIQAFLQREQEEAMAKAEEEVQAKHRQEMIEMERRRPHHFDSSMCAEHISLLPSTSGYNISVEQCTRNMWGSALSSKPLRPSSGVHQWAVRLDKCDSGLVVVGVASANASVDRFIGGNSLSWGVVGTMALWHANTKVKSDYGNTFRTGAVVVATLDTDAGTLRFGLVSDVEAIKSLSSMDVISSDYIEDWGVAFEDLPRNTDLYPAVSLYHRDDKITLLSNVFDNDDTVGDSRSLVSALSSASSLPEEGLTGVDVAKPQEELDATRAVFEIESDKQVQERELALVGQGRAATLGKRH